jgi:membrane fusion protein (multidrug efflux system)
VAARSKRPLVLLLVGALAGGGGLAWYVTHRGLEGTDNAQIDADVVAVPARQGGGVAKVLFAENQQVKEGDLLAELDDAPPKAKLAQAEANLAAAEAAVDASEADTQVVETNAVGNKSVAEASLQTASTGAATTADQIREAEVQVQGAEVSLKQAISERDRARSLATQGAVAQAQLDQVETAASLATSNLEGARARLATMRLSAAQARSRVVEASVRVKQSSDVATQVKLAQARVRSAKAQVEIARASRDLARLDLSYTKIVAPHDGVVSKKTIAVGQAVGAGQTIVQLVTPGRWVTANFKETQVSHMRVGQPVHLEADAYPGVAITGEVESFSGATGSRFTLLPPDNATGNFTKVIQRMPVRIKLQDPPAGVVLRPGMSLELTVDTRK